MEWWCPLRGRGGEHYEYLPTPVMQVEKPLSLQQYQDTEVGPIGLGRRGLILSCASFPKSIKGTRFLLGSIVPRDTGSTGTPSAKPIPLPTVVGSWCAFPSLESRARPSRDCPQPTVQGLGETTNWSYSATFWKMRSFQQPAWWALRTREDTNT